MWQHRSRLGRAKTGIPEVRAAQPPFAADAGRDDCAPPRLKRKRYVASLNSDRSIPYSSRSLKPPECAMCALWQPSCFIPIF